MKAYRVFLDSTQSFKMSFFEKDHKYPILDRQATTCFWQAYIIVNERTVSDFNVGPGNEFFDFAFKKLDKNLIYRILFLYVPNFFNF